MQLGRYACRNLSVSLAVVNKMGVSNFSSSVTLMVAGGKII